MELLDLIHELSSEDPGKPRRLWTGGRRCSGRTPDPEVGGSHPTPSHTHNQNYTLIYTATQAHITVTHDRHTDI